MDDEEEESPLVTPGTESSGAVSMGDVPKGAGGTAPSTSNKIGGSPWGATNLPVTSSTDKIDSLTMS